MRSLTTIWWCVARANRVSIMGKEEEETKEERETGVAEKRRRGVEGIENYCCQNKECPEAGQRGKGNVYFRGWSGKGQRIRMVYCRICKKSFSQRKGTVFARGQLPDDKVVSIMEHLRDGCGTRGTSRLVH